MQSPADIKINPSLFKKLKNKKVGLALGSGGTMGMAHIGVIKFLEEHNIPVHYVAGTSAGAIVGALYAAGKKSSELADIADRLNWLSILRPNMLKFKGMVQHKGLQKILERHLDVNTIEELSLPCTIVATDFDQGKRAYFTSGPIIPAVLASSCIPVLFEPIKYRGKTYVDGFLTESVPIKAVRSMGADFVIAVDLIHSWRNPSFRAPHIYMVAIKAILIAATNAFSLSPEDDADIIISPKFGYVTLFNRASKKASIKKGYDAARAAFT
ncbi:MAG: patatin-like phospholipase family protein [Spirochaetales bacterium]|nr:patatin-like phospholipase family protein [Spirochaetales bacterium]